MPLTMAAFTVAALGMIGLPPLAGYVTKSYLQEGATAAGLSWVGWLLTASSLLNAAYFLPILIRAWFLRSSSAGPLVAVARRPEASWLLVVPPVVTAALVVAAGLSAETSFSPLAWAKLIAAKEYAP
jgi:multicomponent Na+:H+ antiporter subunit D